jgi:ABC-type antimicrobial peptide transport system permease subunit
MAQCPSCQSTNVVITEEVFTRKGRGYYRFLQTIATIGILMVFFAFEAYSQGLFIAILANIIIGILSIINASKRSSSRTKVTCLICKKKHYIH